MKRTVKKGLAIAAVIVTMVVAPLTAQVFLQREKNDISPRANTGLTGHEWVLIPIQGTDIDQYNFVPLGGGSLLLAGLAGAYAFAKSRKKGKK